MVDFRGDWKLNRLNKYRTCYLLGTSDVKGGVTIGLVALNTGADVPFATYEAHQLPSSFVDTIDADDGLEKDGVGKVDLGYPNGAHDVRPFARVGLLERAVLVWTQNATDRRRGRLNAPAAQPLPLGYVRHTVAFLMHGQIAHVAKQNHIAIYTLAVQAYATQGVFIFSIVGLIVNQFNSIQFKCQSNVCGWAYLTWTRSGTFWTCWRSIWNSMRCSSWPTIESTTLFRVDP